MPNFKPSALTRSDEGAETAFELLFVDIPVAEGGVVAFAVAEPTVVHDKHIDAHFSGFVCERDKLIIVKIEICGLPAVDEHGAFHIAPRTFDEVLHVGAVENAAHLAETPYRCRP